MLTYSAPASTKICACSSIFSGGAIWAIIKKPTGIMPSSRAAFQMLDGNVRFGHMGSHTHDLCPIGPGLLQILNGPPRLAAAKRPAWRA